MRRSSTRSRARGRPDGRDTRVGSTPTYCARSPGRPRTGRWRLSAVRRASWSRSRPIWSGSATRRDASRPSGSERREDADGGARRQRDRVLHRVFGGEMTMTRVECGRCEACGPLAECEVYLGGPGVVVRCRACHTIMMVLVEVREMTCVDLGGVRELELPP